MCVCVRGEGMSPLECGGECVLVQEVVTRTEAGGKQTPYQQVLELQLSTSVCLFVWMEIN